ncbi:MAG: formate--tetrahydrofolate ligase [Bacilli bacterium]
MKSDIEIAQNIVPKNITEISKKIRIDEKYISCFGKYKAKVDYNLIDENKVKNTKLILVTAVSPTPLGEGKTTITIGLNDALCKLGKKSILSLREPSLGPVFGLKGGATGGGYAQVMPMEDINLHFTGDIHAIGAANNLLSAIIDNHIYQGNELDIQKITWKRCVDINDRQLRMIECGLGGKYNGIPRLDGFDITVASEIMAVFCLSNTLTELKEKIGNITIGYNSKKELIYAKDLKAEGALTVLLKEAFNPNLVQTLEHNPVFIHGGPFANIAHGCNSIVSTKLAMSFADIVITEAGFGSDLGAEKFLNIKCEKGNFNPNVIVLVSTIKSMKYQDVESNKLNEGIKNLQRHIDNCKNVYGLNVVVALNKFSTDTKEEINQVKKLCDKMQVDFSISEVFEKGSNGGIDLANKVLKNIGFKKYNNIYNENDSLEFKITQVASKVYKASNIEFNDVIVDKLKEFEQLGYSNLPICIAKTPTSFTHNSKILGAPNNFTLKIEDVILNSGAGFIVVIVGKIMRMPGLPKIAAFEKIDIDKNNNIIGLF